MTAICGVYEIVNLNDGRMTAYVGSSNDIRARWGVHRGRLRRGVHWNPHLQAAWNKYGEAGFWFEVIEKVEDQAVLYDREQHWLVRFRNYGPVYNMCPVAGSTRGRKLTEEHRQKMSASLKGLGKGKKLTEEHKRKISEGGKGTTRPLFTVAQQRRIAEAQRGHRRSHSLETCRKISQALRGCIRVKGQPALIHVETGEVVPEGPSLCQFCRERGFGIGHMSRVRSGKQRSHHGWMLLEKGLAVRADPEAARGM